MPELVDRLVKFLRASRKAIVAFAALAAYFGLDVSSGSEALDAAIGAALVWLTPNAQD